MVTLEQWHTIRHLASIGNSYRWIAKTLSISRVTVTRAVNQEEFDEYQREPTVLGMLDSFRPVVEQGIGRGLSGKRLLGAVSQSGYSGSAATFYRWLAGVRKDLSNGSSCRFETGPGEQAQFDWSPYVLEIGGEFVPVIIFSLLLGYSRQIHFYPSLSERQDSVIEGLEVGLRNFGGSCRFVLIDNAKSMVLRHRRSQLVWNACFLAFCGHYRIQPIAAAPVHPQTKGKVENPFKHLENNLLIGNVWRDWQHFSEHLAAYEEERAQCVHTTTRQAPATRFEDERDSLLKLPPNPFVGCPRHMRQLNNDGLISFEGNRYCVPATKGLDHVRVRTRQGRELLVFDPSGSLLICHSLAPKYSPPVLLPECYEALKARRRLSLATQTTLLRQRFSSAEVVDEYLACLLERHQHHPEEVLSGVLQLLDAVPDQIALRVLADAANLKLPEAATVADLLQRHLTSAPAQNAPAAPLNRPVPALDVERPLSVYASFLPQLNEEKTT